MEPLLQYTGSRRPTILDIENLQSHDFRLKFFKENKSVFLAIEKYILDRLLCGHLHCILQLLELRKEEGCGFNEICPYAYAFVFWRRSVLELGHFYRRHREDIDPPGNFELAPATRLIEEEIRFLFDEYLRHNSKVGVDEFTLFWILNRVTAQFCVNFFMEWMEIAEKGAHEESTPSWSEITIMKNTCFPRFAFRYNIRDDRQTIDFFTLNKMTTKGEMPYYQCPNKSVSNRKKINRMNSYLPQRVAMMMFENQSDENKELQRYVEHYIRKLNF